MDILKDLMDVNVIIPATFTLLGGLCGYFLKYLLDKKKDAYSKIAAERRVFYYGFVDSVINLLKTIKENKGDASSTNAIDNMHEFYKKYILYASPDVIISFSDFMQSLYHQKEIESKESTKEFLKKLGTVFHDMRKDLSLSNKNMKDGLMLLRAIFVDFDTTFPNEDDLMSQN